MDDYNIYIYVKNNMSNNDDNATNDSNILRTHTQSSF